MFLRVIFLSATLSATTAASGAEVPQASSQGSTPGQMSDLLPEEVGDVAPSFEIDSAGVRQKHAEIEAMMAGVRFHVFRPDTEFADFFRSYRRSADVVPASLLGFLSDPQQSAKAFIETGLQSDAWKKPSDAELSFIWFLPLRTARDRVRINYARLHERTLDVEVDQLCPIGTPELGDTVYCVIEIPLGTISPGSFHYTTNLNRGQQWRPLSEHPQGWEYADAAALSHSGGSGCTIVGPDSDAASDEGMPPVRESQFLGEARLDVALERLRHAEFPMEAARFLELVGLSVDQQNRPANFGWSAEKGSLRLYQLTGPPIVHILEILEDESRKTVHAASIYYLSDFRKYTLYQAQAPASRPVE